MNNVSGKTNVKEYDLADRASLCRNLQPYPAVKRTLEKATEETVKAFEKRKLKENEGLAPISKE